jgi:TRAP-type mannitol/chloroaromatic compound transport system permease small subunit
VLRQGFVAFSLVLDRLARAVCMTAGLVLTGAVLSVVVLRYGFGIGFIQLQDLAVYAFAVFVIFALPVCMARDGHVRVEVVSERMPPGYRRAADGVALVVFLIPVFGLVIWAYWPELIYSWSIRERSVETGGLRGLFVVKSALPVAAALMIVQGLAAMLRTPIEGARGE